LSLVGWVNWSRARWARGGPSWGLGNRARKVWTAGAKAGGSSVSLGEVGRIVGEEVGGQQGDAGEVGADELGGLGGAQDWAVVDRRQRDRR
jgi:hypothetical protein